MAIIRVKDKDYMKGDVLEFERNRVLVKLANGKVIGVPYHEFEVIETAPKEPSYCSFERK